MKELNELWELGAKFDKHKEHYGYKTNGHFWIRIYKRKSPGPTFPCKFKKTKDENLSDSFNKLRVTKNNS